MISQERETFDALQRQRDNFFHPHFRPLKQWKRKRNSVKQCYFEIFQNITFPNLKL
jgi:hypothetical protein